MRLGQQQLDTCSHVVAGTANLVGAGIGRDDFANQRPHLIGEFDPRVIGIGERPRLHVKAAEVVRCTATSGRTPTSGRTATRRRTTTSRRRVSRAHLATSISTGA
jgi:hypothetical protein